MPRDRVLDLLATRRAIARQSLRCCRALQSWCGAGKGSHVAGRPLDTGSERQRRAMIGMFRSRSPQHDNCGALWCHRSITCQHEDSRRGLESLTGGWWVCEALWKRIVKATASLVMPQEFNRSSHVAESQKSSGRMAAHQCTCWIRLERVPADAQYTTQVAFISMKTCRV
ncbi:uncharacterized protein CC84DRAFT_570386 [Paraphaeosphaeria sporulosa]|uniref:Uncharacterized protein n=1 Tax=Paraphaeosphaeria sporulosa TaxID=1460663 RepID=A0A177CM20_9PLEO|nr:uncharacterized protein CC84DRAFT_570386 [Paraphaeosphaeria sporulosa]OAG08301.1 hypothetical protein CC84DRAFT_570386 [Paraphaeosphaeria sporulosa]